MKGLILAAGKATRMYPLTESLPKALLPVAHKPLCQYGMEKIKSLGITECAIVVSREHLSIFQTVLGNSKAGMNLTYLVAEEPGAAGALKAAEDFCRDEQIVCVLADNLFNSGLDEILESRRRFPYKAQCFTYTPKDLEELKSLGVMEYSKLGNPIRVIEKSLTPPSKDAVVGIYYFPKGNLFSKILSELTLSERNEYEITDVLNAFIKEDKMMFNKLSGVWMDVGTQDALSKAQFLAISWISPFG